MITSGRKALLLFKAYGNEVAYEGNEGYEYQEFIEVLNNVRYRLYSLFLLTNLCLGSDNIRLDFILFLRCLYQLYSFEIIKHFYLALFKYLLAIDYNLSTF